MAFTEVDVNSQNFSEVTENDKQVTVTNNLGRTALFQELVYLDGYFGEVKEVGGIANGATGKININAERKIKTQQVEATDTFTAGNTLWFAGGGAGAAGTLEDANGGSDLAVGIITGEEGTGGAQTAVEFRPFVQRLDASDVSAQVIVNTAGIASNLVDIGTVASLTTTAKTDCVVAINEVNAEADANAAAILVEQAEPKILVYKVIADASSPVAIPGLVENDEIIDVKIVCSASNANGTLLIETGGADDITDGMICAVDTTVVGAGTIDDAYSTLPASGAAVLSVGGTAADTRGVVIITYIPA